MPTPESEKKADTTSAAAQTSEAGQTETATQQTSATEHHERDDGDDGAPLKLTSAQLKKRLEETRAAARERLLRDLGFEGVDDAKKKLGTWQALEQSQLSEAEKREKLIKDLEPRAKRAEHLERLLGAVVEQRFAELPEKVRDAIGAAAGEAVERRLELMMVLEAAGVGQQTRSTAQEGSSSASSAKVTSTTSGAAAAAPRPSGATSVWDRYQELERTNPIAASIFYQTNRLEVERGRPATP